MATGVVDINSDIKRKKWMSEGLIQKASISNWAPLMGNTKDAAVYQVNQEGAKEGHTVVFDYEGNLSKKALKGKESATGKGEQKKMFSDKITVDRYRFVVDNGDAFDGVDIGNLKITQHEDSRAKLADLFVRFKDQGLYDASQGNLGQSASHIIDLGSTFDVNSLHDIDRILKTGTGFSTGSVRRPPEPIMDKEGRPMWIMKVDAAMAAKLKKSTNYQTLVYNADVRGQNNRAFTGVIGKIGNLIIQEDPTFFGVTNAGTSWGLNSTDIEIAGMRQFDTVNTVWTGQEGFDYASTLKSRGIIIGAGALQLGMGKMPDYKYQDYDFEIKSESLLETWMEIRKCRKFAENEDYENAKVAGHDWGMIAVDVQI